MARRRVKKSLFSRYYVRATLLLCIPVLLTFLAQFYWVFDLFSHFTLQYTLVAVLLFVLLLLSKRMGWALLALVLTISQAHQLVPLWTPVSKEDGKRYEEVTMLQYNVHRNNDNIDEMARWVISRSEEIDIVVLMEITDKWQLALERIKWTYPYHISKKMPDDKEIVVLSKLLIDELEVKNLGDGDTPVVVMRGVTDGYEIPFVLYGAHPPPPVLSGYAERRNSTLQAAARSIADESVAHKLLVGDLNITRYSPWFKKTLTLSGLHDSYEGLGIMATWPSVVPGVLGLTIDHSLVSDNIVVSERRLGPRMGSDHFPVLTTFEFKVPGKV